jgi:hypothetical protein
MAGAEPAEQGHEQDGGYPEDDRRDRIAVRGVKLEGECSRRKDDQRRQVSWASPAC